jgi:hypothetical protein
VQTMIMMLVALRPVNAVMMVTMIMRMSQVRLSSVFISSNMLFVFQGDHMQIHNMFPHHYYL